MRNINSKLAVHSRTQAIALARSGQLIWLRRMTQWAKRFAERSTGK